MSEAFADEEVRRLTPFFTNLDRPVFGLKLPQEVSGALFSRYSRSSKSLRRVFLVGYGDDSVAQLGGAHVAVERVSNVAAKVLEDARIGIAFLEKSTRYVRF